MEEFGIMCWSKTYLDLDTKHNRYISQASQPPRHCQHDSICILESLCIVRNCFTRTLFGGA